MRDGSASYWFQVGDAVRVCAPVVKSGVDLRGRVGIVREAWEKCDVDPTCCCAEQVDRNMAVRVEFPGALDDGDDHDRLSGSSSSSTFSHYFGEDELVKVVADSLGRSKNQSTAAESPPAGSVAFDGIGCAAFKLEALQIESKKRKLASFDPAAPTAALRVGENAATDAQN